MSRSLLEAGSLTRPASVPALGGVVSTADPKYRLRADAKTLTDGVATAASAVITSATAAFTPADIGKVIVVNGAGQPVTGATSSALSTGAPITSVPVAALAADFPAGGVILTSGANTQTFKSSTGATAGATSIPVVSQTPTFAFPSGTAASAPPAAHFSTIASWQSATQVTMAAAAPVAGTALEIVYGTDNAAGLQQAINDAAASGAHLRIAPAAEGHLYTGTLTVPTGVDITGSGAHEVFGSAVSNGFNGLNFPVYAPYLTGSVLICASPNTDAVQLTTPSTVNDFTAWGVRFAGRFANTGHGLHVLPPITSGPYRDNGLLSSRWASLKVYGHDGNHYAYRIFNPLYNHLDSVRSYGGGCIDYIQASNLCSCGNSVITHPFGVVLVAGSAFGTWIHNSQNPSPSNLINYVVTTRPQMWTLNPTPSIPGVVGPIATQKNWSYESVGTVNKCTLIAPDFETNVGATSSLSIPIGYVVGGGAVTGTAPGQAFQAGPTSGTIYRNLEGTNVYAAYTYDLTALPGAAATVLIEASNNSDMSGSYVLAEEGVPAATTGTWRRTLSVVLLRGAYMRVTVTNATRVRNGYTTGLPGSV